MWTKLWWGNFFDDDDGRWKLILKFIVDQSVVAVFTELSLLKMGCHRDL